MGFTNEITNKSWSESENVSSQVPVVSGIGVTVIIAGVMTGYICNLWENQIFINVSSNTRQIFPNSIISWGDRSKNPAKLVTLNKPESFLTLRTSLPKAETDKPCLWQLQQL